MWAPIPAALKVVERHPGKAFLGVLVLGGLAYFGMFSPGAPAVPAKPATAPIPTIGVQRPLDSKKLLDAQEENIALRDQMQEQGRRMLDLQQALAKTTEAQKTQAQALEDKLAAFAKQTQASAQQAQQARKVVPQPVAVAPPQAPPVSTPPPARPTTEGQLKFYKATEKSPYEGTPPSSVSGQTAYLTEGSFANARAITGVMATAQKEGALPVLLAVTGPFHSPFQLQGAGLPPLATGVPMQGCFQQGSAAASLANSRVLIQLTRMSCVFPDKASWERPIRGYVVGADGTFGVVGKLEVHNGAALVRAFLTSLIAGAGEAFALAKRVTIVTPLGGTTTAMNGSQIGEAAGFSALSLAAAQLSQFYLQQASQLMPTLWLPSDSVMRVVMQEGLPLDDFPLTTTMVSQEAHR